MLLPSIYALSVRIQFDKDCDTYRVLDVKLNVVEPDLADGGVALVYGELSGDQWNTYLEQVRTSHIKFPYL